MAARRAHQGKEVVITSTGKERRDCMDVDAMLSAMALASANGRADVDVTIPITLDGHRIARFVIRASKVGFTRRRLGGLTEGDCQRVNDGGKGIA